MRPVRVNLAVAIASLALCACATSPREPQIVTKLVKVPVAARCAIDVRRPDLPDTDAAIAAAGDIDVLARMYRAGRLLRDAYIAELEAALGGCAGQS